MRASPAIAAGIKESVVVDGGHGEAARARKPQPSAATASRVDRMRPKPLLNKILIVAWYGLILVMMLTSFVRIIAVADLGRIVAALITWPGILALPLLLALAAAVVMSAVFFGGMIVYSLREKDGR
jgi:hypothetical protein